MGGLLYTAQNKIGARETLSPSASGPGPEKTILQLRGRHEHAQNLSIVVAPVVGDFTRGKAIHPCVALLTWGAGGASTRAEVDIGRGTQLQFAASFVSISGRNDAGVDDGTGNPIDSGAGPQDVVAIISGVGSRSAFGRVTRTFYFGPIAPGVSRLIPVAPFAKTFLITRTPPATAITVDVADGIIRTIEDATGAVILSPATLRDEYTFGAGVAAPRIDLYAQAGAVRIANTGAARIAALQIAFELSF